MVVPFSGQSSNVPFSPTGVHSFMLIISSTSYQNRDRRDPADQATLPRRGLADICHAGFSRRPTNKMIHFDEARATWKKAQLPAPDCLSETDWNLPVDSEAVFDEIPNLLDDSSQSFGRLDLQSAACHDQHALKHGGLLFSMNPEDRIGHGLPLPATCFRGFCQDQIGNCTIVTSKGLRNCISNLIFRVPYSAFRCSYCKVGRTSKRPSCVIQGVLGVLRSECAFSV